jgi:hypothetical protein
LSGIRTHDLSVRAGEDSSYLRPRGYCDQLLIILLPSFPALPLLFFSIFLIFLFHHIFLFIHFFFLLFSYSSFRPPPLTPSRLLFSPPFSHSNRSHFPILPLFLLLLFLLHPLPLPHFCYSSLSYFLSFYPISSSSSPFLLLLLSHIFYSFLLLFLLNPVLIICHSLFSFSFYSIFYSLFF